MKVFHWFFILSFVFLLLVLALFFIPVTPGSTGMLHDKFQTMLHSGTDGRGSSLFIGFFIGLLILGIFSFCIYLGIQRNGQPGPLARWLWIGLAGYFVVFVVQILLYRNYDPINNSAFIAGYPIPTAWMIYAMWGYPIVFTIIYLLSFDKWIFTAEDEANYRALKDSLNS